MFGRFGPLVDSKSPAKSRRKAVGAETTTSVRSGSLDKTLRHELFDSFDKSECSSRGSNQSRSHSFNASAKHKNVSHRDYADNPSGIHRSRSNPSDCGDRSAGTYVDTAQEEQDPNVLRYAPENKPWIPSELNLSDCKVIPLEVNCPTLRFIKTPWS